jgi:hypothetical protein
LIGFARGFFGTHPSAEDASWGPSPGDGPASFASAKTRSTSRRSSSSKRSLTTRTFRE